MGGTCLLRCHLSPMVASVRQMNGGSFFSSISPQNLHVSGYRGPYDGHICRGIEMKHEDLRHVLRPLTRLGEKRPRSPRYCPLQLLVTPLFRIGPGFHTAPGSPTKPPDIGSPFFCTLYTTLTLLKKNLNQRHGWARKGADNDAQGAESTPSLFRPSHANS